MTKWLRINEDGTVDMGFRRGDTWTMPFNIAANDGTPVDLTGKTFEMHGRKKPDGPLVVDFSTYVDAVDEDAGDAEFGVPSTISSDFDWDVLHYDIRLNSGGSPANIETLWEGRIYNEKGYTHAE